MSSFRLFLGRMGAELKYQRKVLSTVFDWTVLVYIILPIVIISPLLYRDFWEHVGSYWNEDIPFALILFPLALITLRGNWRTRLLEADLIYFIQQKNTLRQLKQWSMMVSLLGISFKVGFGIIGLLPLLIEIYGMHFYEIMIIALQIATLYSTVYTVKKMVNNSLLKWFVIGLALLMMLFIILHIQPLYGVIISLVVLGLILWHQIGIIAATNRYFYEELEIEQNEKSRYIKMILDFSQDVEKSGGSRRMKPRFLFRNSKQLFSSRTPKNGLAEFVIKGFIRDKQSILMLLQITGVTSFAIATTPLVFKWVILVCFIFFLHSWLNAVFHKMLGNSFFDVVPYDSSIEDDVWRTFKWFVYYPVIVFIGVITIVSTVSTSFLLFIS